MAHTTDRAEATTAQAAACAWSAPEYVIVCADRRGELYLPERDLGRCGPLITVTDILCGQVERVRAVYRHGQDVSATIAAEVRRIATVDGEEIPRVCLDFIEEHCGCEPLAPARRGSVGS